MSLFQRTRGAKNTLDWGEEDEHFEWVEEVDEDEGEKEETSEPGEGKKEKKQDEDSEEDEEGEENSEGEEDEGGDSDNEIIEFDPNTHFKEEVIEYDSEEEVFDEEILQMIDNTEFQNVPPPSEEEFQAIRKRM